jgi:C_GCAxxG_C_C family probable redox protein
MSDCEIAKSSFLQGFNCSQAVFSTLATQFGIDRDAALRIAGLFGGGIGRSGETCGAVTGALMVLGLKYSYIDPADAQAKEQAYAQAQEFLRRFQARHGTVMCKHLIGYDVSTPEGLQQAREQKVFHSICPAFVGSAVEIVEQMLAE